MWLFCVLFQRLYMVRNGACNIFLGAEIKIAVLAQAIQIQWVYLSQHTKLRLLKIVLLVICAAKPLRHSTSPTFMAACSIPMAQHIVGVAVPVSRNLFINVLAGRNGLGLGTGNDQENPTRVPDGISSPGYNAVPTVALALSNAFALALKQG